MLRTLIATTAIALSACVPTQMQMQATPVYGAYIGTIASGDHNDGVTRLFADASGDIQGTYSFGQDMAEQGRLLDCALKALKLQCRWQDAYGEGDLYVTFTPDYRSFDGLWYTGPKSAKVHDGLEWSGERADFLS